ncbi:helix-turn-helix domain-containing protein [Variovorax soli]|uniref:DNA-binding IclR family transcriptional regulator n=1 Tax=Variovorax soli TaxID=376815 RepID=A0ABU1NHS4_9BURK|nr:helix-turn-helix domain-containing protein [Variovorax soli]MDR6538017.1 DNA-binding IclR family transcriptional regulator [Variovorax soli]
MPREPKAEPQPRRRHHEAPTLNRSLERGIEVLRAFRPGADLLGNGEIAERTSLSRATVSRLTQTLVGSGLLEHDRVRRAYRLAAPVLSFAHAMRAGSPVLNAAAPLMRALAEKMHINVGLAVADRDEMVYLESVRYNRRVSLRNVVAGQRVPMELTSLGRAYLAVVQASERRALMGLFRSRRASEWRQLRSDIEQAKLSVEQRGYCTASWQPEVVALATPLIVPDGPIYVLNVSVSTAASLRDAEAELSGVLLDLSVKIGAVLGAASDPRSAARGAGQNQAGAGSRS